MHDHKIVISATAEDDEGNDDGDDQPELALLLHLGLGQVFVVDGGLALEKFAVILRLAALATEARGRLGQLEGLVLVEKRTSNGLRFQLARFRTRRFGDFGRGQIGPLHAGLEFHDHAAHLDHVAGAEDDFADDFAVDVGAIGGIEIAQDDIGTAVDDDAVAVGDRGIGQGNLVIRGTADVGVFLRKLVDGRRLVRAGDGELRLAILHADGDRFRGGDGLAADGAKHAVVGAAGALEKELLPGQRDGFFVGQDILIEREAAAGPEEHGVDRFLALGRAAKGVKNATLLNIDEAVRFARAESNLTATPAETAHL